MESKNEKKTNKLINPSWTKKQKMLYFLWLDDQVMTYWSRYLDLKHTLPDGDFWPKEAVKELDDCLVVIEYFEKYQKEISDEYPYEEIDKFVRAHPEICKNFTFFRFFS